MADLVILGAGGLGRMTLDILLCAGQRPVAFLDSDPRKHKQVIDGVVVRGGFDQLHALRREGLTRAIVAIGDNVTRVSVAEQALAAGFRLAAAIHPFASVSATAEIAEHVIIGARAIVGVHAAIGPHCVIGAGAIVEHDNRIERGAFLHPAVRLAGTVTIGAGATLGIGASVIPGRKVGAGARIEAGAVVIRDVPPAAHVAGVPAQAA